MKLCRMITTKPEHLSVNICFIMKNILYMFLTTYGVVKCAFGIAKGSLTHMSWPKKIIVQSVLLVISSCLLLLQLVSLIPFIAIRTMINLYLTFKLGAKYGGLLCGQDAMIDSGEEKTAVIVVLILNSDDDPDIFCSKLTKELQCVHDHDHDSNNKLSMSVKSFCGYLYYLKDQTTKDDIAKIITVNQDDYLTKEVLLDYLHQGYMKAPIQGTRLWYSHILTQPVRWSKTCKTKNQYAVVLVFRHCLADGVALIALLKNFMIRDISEDMMKLDHKYTVNPHLSLDDLYVNSNPLDKPSKLTISEGSDRQFAILIEEEIKYVPLVKKLKRSLNVGFTDILLAGLSASLNEYAAKRGQVVDYMSIGVVFRPIHEDLVNIVNGSYDYNNITNDATVVLVKVPIAMKANHSNLERLKAVKHEIDLAKHSIDGLAFYAYNQLGNLVPSPIIKYVMDYTSALGVCGISNVGGLKAGTVVGYTLETAVSFLPKYFETGFNVSIFSKGDCFQLAVTSNNNLVYNRDELQDILQNIFNYVDALDKETEI